MRIPTLITTISVLTLLTACGGAGTEPTSAEASAPAEGTAAPAGGGHEQKGTSIEVNEGGLQVDSKAADVQLSTDSLKIQLGK